MVSEQIPSLSLVVPVYNVAPYLPRCLDSLVSQSGVDFEVIIIDDGSTDSCQQILSYYAAKFPEILRVFRQKNEGLSAARNFGLDQVRGRYVGFVDSDDWIDEDYFRKLLELAEREDLDMAHGNAMYHFEGRREDFPIYKDDLPEEVMTGRELLRRRLHNKSLLHMVWLHIYRRDFLEMTRLRFVPKLIHEDVQWTTIALLAARRVAYLHIPGYHYRQRIRRRSPPELDRHLENIIYSSIQNASALEGIALEIKDDIELQRLVRWQLTDGALSIFHKLSKFSNLSTKSKLDKSLREQGMYGLLWRNSISIAQRRKILKYLLKSYIS